MSGEVENENNKKIFLSVPFSDSSHELKKSFRKIFRNFPNVKLIFTSRKIIDYFSNKCHTHQVLKSNLVYQFKCHGCENSYIGETNRHLRTRMLEHGQQSRNSSIYGHISKCVHRNKKLDISEFKILNSNFNNYFERVTCEALRIQDLKPSLNVQAEDLGLLQIFNS